MPASVTLHELLQWQYPLKPVNFAERPSGLVARSLEDGMRTRNGLGKLEKWARGTRRK